MLQTYSVILTVLCHPSVGVDFLKKSTEVWLNVDSEGGSDRGQQKGGRGLKGFQHLA